MLTLAWFVGRPLIGNLRDPEQFRDIIDQHGFLSRIVFIGVVMLQVIIAIIPGEPFEIFAGYAFGIVEGTLLCLIGILLGSILVFLFVRYFGKKAVEVFFTREKINSLKFLNTARKRNTLIFIIFLIPGTPKDLLCYIVGLTEIKLSTWIIITSLARIPSVITSIIGGDALGMQNYLFAIVVFAATAVISAVGLILYNKWNKKLESEHAAKHKKAPASRRRL